MARVATALFAAVTLGFSAFAWAGGDPTVTPAKPSSFAPRAQGSGHVYGAPIGPAIVGHRAAGHRGRTQTARPATAPSPLAHSTTKVKPKAKAPAGPKVARHSPNE
jgi:hypothetical protein